MLQGTFETLSLPEVLGLLASARKSGALWLEAGPVTGVAHLEDGHCRAAEAGDQRGPVENGSALLTRLVDMCFAVMCQESGSFRFAADDPAPWVCADQVELSDVLVEVDRLLKQWREILRVIPSLECRPQLLDALQVDELVIDRERWALLVAMDGRRTVRELVQRTNRPVIELCQTLLELVDAGAVGVIDPAAARAPEAEPAAHEVAAPEVNAAGAVTPEPAAAEVAVRDVPAPGVPAPEVPAPEVPVPEVVVTQAPEPEVAVGAPIGTAPQPAHSAAAIEPTELAPAVVLTIVPEHDVPVDPQAPRPESAPPVAEPEVAVAAAATDHAPDSAPDSAPDKGAFLRLFSGLRDS